MTVLAVSAVMVVSVMTATPLKLNPPFDDPDVRAQTIFCVTRNSAVSFSELPQSEVRKRVGGRGFRAQNTAQKLPKFVCPFS